MNGSCDLAFRLYDDASAGSQVGNAITRTVAISAGLFSVNLDFGAGVFVPGPGDLDGHARWLEIAVQCAGDSGYANLGRQELMLTLWPCKKRKFAWRTNTRKSAIDKVSDDT